MSLLLLLAYRPPIVEGIGAGSQAPQTGAAAGTFTPAVEVIELVLPIQTVVMLTLPMGQTPPVIVPPWVTA